MPASEAASASLAPSISSRSRGLSGTRLSGTPGKRREMPIVALAGEAEAKPEALHLRLARTRQRQAAVGRMGGVVDVERLAGAVARGHALDLEGEDAGDLGSAAETVGGKADVVELDAAEVAHQIVAHHLRRAAGLAAGDPGQRAALDIVGLGIDDAAEHPAAVRHDAPRSDDQGELQAVEHDVAVAAAIDAIDHERDAVLM